MNVPGDDRNYVDYGRGVEPEEDTRPVELPLSEHKTTFKKGDRARTPTEPLVMLEVLSVYHSNWSGRDIVLVKFQADWNYHRAGRTCEFYAEDLTKVDETEE